MPCVPAWQRGLRADMLACQRGLRANVLACKRVKSVHTSHVYVPLFYLGVLIFQTFLLQSAKEDFYTLLLHKKFYILLDIIVMHIICICILYYYIKNSISYLIS